MRPPLYAVVQRRNVGRSDFSHRIDVTSFAPLPAMSSFQGWGSFESSVKADQQQSARLLKHERYIRSIPFQAGPASVQSGNNSLHVELRCSRKGTEAALSNYRLEAN
jgi:hypothetical protein